MYCGLLYLNVWGTVDESERRRVKKVNWKQPGLASTERDDLEALPSESQPTIAKASVVDNRCTQSRNFTHDALTEGLEVLNDFLVYGNLWNKESDGVKEERQRLLEEMTSYNMKKEQLEDTALEAKVAMRE